MKIRTYSELIKIPSFEDRFRYLQLNGSVGDETFGQDRYLNQRFYTSREWRAVRDFVIIRDTGIGDYCRDLAADGYDISDGQIVIHHMNPILVTDIIKQTDILLNPDYLIATSDSTHKAIHYSTLETLITAPIERRKNDTCPWKK